MDIIVDALLSLIINTFFKILTFTIDGINYRSVEVLKS